MAYGAILGQTPILTADGITYDNSKTSGVIKGNNVQDAIDQTVGKLETLSSGFQWVKLGERLLKDDEIISRGDLVFNSFINKNEYSNCFGIMVCFSGKMTRTTGQALTLYADRTAVIVTTNKPVSESEDTVFNNVCAIGMKAQKENKDVFINNVSHLLNAITISDYVRLIGGGPYSYDITQTVYGLKLL